MNGFRQHLRATLIVAALFIATPVSQAAADTLTLMWDLNTEPDVTGYQVHIGQQSGVYTQTIDVGNTDTFVLANAVAGQQYCFVVTAYAGDLVSPYSSEVCSLDNQPPFLSQPFNQRTNVSQSATLQLSGGDPEGNPVTYSVSGLPPGLSVNASTGFIAGVPNTVGTFSVVASVSDGSLSTSRTFLWTVVSGNSPPVLTNPGSLITDVGQSVSLQLTASDPDGQPISFTAAGLPPGLTIGTNTGAIVGQPTTAGSYTVTVTVSDGSLTASQTFAWTIRTANLPPALTNPGSQTSTVGQVTTLQLHASDPNGDVLTYVAAGLPVGLQLAPDTGVIAGTPSIAGNFNVTVTVSDGSLFTSQTFAWSVRNANQAPTLTNPGSQTGDVGQPSLLQLQATDPNGDALTFSATGLPAGLQLATSTGRITGTPTTAGTFNVVATVSDGSLTASQSFAWTVRAANVAPVLTNPGAQVTDVSQVVSLQLQATDANGDTLTFQASGLPIGLQINAGTGRITGIPTAQGFYNVSVTVTDGALIATQTFTWTIRTPNVAPTLTNPGTQTTDVNQPVVLQLQASDANGDAVTFTATGLPAGLQMTAATGRIAGAPTTVGTNAVNVTVSDGSLTASQSFTWTIRRVNTAPVLTDPPDQTTGMGVPVSLQLQATDADNDTLSFSASGLPTGMQIAAATGLISGTPTTVGVFSVTVSVSDGVASVSQIITWTIFDPAADSHAPTLSNPGAQHNIAGDVIALQLSANDIDNDPLTYSANGLPPGLVLNSTTGMISGSPTTAGRYTVVLSVTDGTSSVDQGFTWTISTVNVAPVLTNPGDQTNSVNQFVVLPLQASDGNGDTLTFSAIGLPTGLQVSPTTGVVSGTPTIEGRYSVQITVSDGTLSTSQSFFWTIDHANVPPSLTAPGNQTAMVNQPAVLQLQASDSDGDSLTFAATGLPPGLVLTSSTGRITGTPTTEGSYPVVVSVSDGTVSVQQSFTWTVLPPNVAPVLTNPGAQNTTAGASVVLQLQATDANGDPLGYAAAGLPRGLTLTTSTGRIAGTPTTPGTYSVVVSVSDGALSAQQTFIWTINAANVAPTLASPGNQISSVNQAASLQLLGSDANGDVLTYSATGLPSGMALVASTGLISGTATTAGTYSVVATVSDGTLTAQRSFTWTIQPANGTPVLTNPGNQRSTVGQSVVLQLRATDPNGDRLVYAIVGVPPGITLNPSTGLITGTPLAAGVFQVTASVSDGLLSMQQSFTWTVIGPNLAPALVNPGNQTSNVGDGIALQLIGSDLNNDRLTYSATGLPPGLQLSSTTGLIAGTVNALGSYPVMVAVSDGSLIASRTFTWNVIVPQSLGTATVRSTSNSVYTGQTAVERPTTDTETRTATGLTAMARNDTATAPSTSVPTGTIATLRSVARTSNATTTTLSAIMAHPSPVDTSSATSSTASTSTTHSLLNDGPDPVLQAVTRDDSAVSTQTTTIAADTSDPSASLPSVAIETPVDHATFAVGSTVHFMATATDAAGANLSSRVVWTSSLQGTLGIGGSITKVLSTGTHTITATVTDSRGRKQAVSIVVTVE
jgi:hypothetical protein